MGSIDRTFLLGAGFSKVVADGPLMKELWCHIEKAYKREKSRDVSPEYKKGRIDWFNKLNDFITRLEKEATSRFERYDSYKIFTEIKESLEYLITLIDLQLNGPNIRFERAGSHIDPYPAILLRFTSKDELERIRNNLQTYLYLVLNRLEGGDLAEKFAEVITLNDQIITFNYDLVLEKSLLRTGKWIPLNGYAGVERFEKDSYRLELEKKGKYSQLRIHKMHGSINWGKPGIPERARKNDDIVIVMDDRENNKFHFEGLLERNPDKINPGYVGSYEPEWLLPSFVKPFEKKEIYEIWQSAIKAMSKTNELVIIGYSFRPEDSNAFLLLSMLPPECDITLVDPYPKEIEKRLEDNGFKIARRFFSLQEYLSGK